MGGGGAVGFGLVCQVGPLLGSEKGCFRTWQWTFLHAKVCTNVVQGFWGCGALSNMHVPVLLQAVASKKMIEQR